MLGRIFADQHPPSPPGHQESCSEGGSERLEDLEHVGRSEAEAVPGVI